jgi:hypothetical protein
LGHGAAIALTWHLVCCVLLCVSVYSQRLMRDNSQFEVPVQCNAVTVNTVLKEQLYMFANLIRFKI